LITAVLWWLGTSVLFGLASVATGTYQQLNSPGFTQFNALGLSPKGELMATGVALLIGGVMVMLRNVKSITNIDSGWRAKGLIEGLAVVVCIVSIFGALAVWGEFTSIQPNPAPGQKPIPESTLHLYSLYSWSAFFAAAALSSLANLIAAGANANKKKVESK
jgi:NADH:ubiquinone oxidoreductase subunit 6 (subunit J)